MRKVIIILASLLTICLILMVMAVKLWMALPIEDAIRITDPEFNLPDQPIVFSVPDQTGDVFGFIDPDGSDFTTRSIALRMGVVLVGGIRWGSDGSSLVTTANNDIFNEYERLPTLITNKGEVHICKGFSTNYARGLDNTHIMMELEVAGSTSSQIVDLNMETCQIEKVIYTASTNMFDFDISADGWIAYLDLARGIVVLDDQQREIFTISDGASPAWSKNGDWLTYTTFTGTDRLIYIVNRNGTDTQLITSDGACPAWSDDGEWLIYNRYTDIYIVNIVSKESRLLYSGGECASWRWDTPMTGTP